MAESTGKGLSEYFSVKMFLTLIAVIVVVIIVAYMMKPTAAKPDPTTLKTQTDCEKAGYKWDATTNTCTKVA